LDKELARRTDLELITDNIHKRQVSMPAVGFEPVIPESEWPQTYGLIYAGIGIESEYTLNLKYSICAE
jgi:hypothetical protein